MGGTSSESSSANIAKAAKAKKFKVTTGSNASGGVRKSKTGGRTAVVSGKIASRILAFRQGVQKQNKANQKIANAAKAKRKSAADAAAKRAAARKRKNRKK